MKLGIAEMFSPFPGGRFRSDGPFSGQEFREDHLAPALHRGDKVIVGLDGVKGLPPSFLEEAFGGLIRSGFPFEYLESHLEIDANGAQWARYPALVWSYIAKAAGHVSQRAG